MNDHKIGAVLIIGGGIGGIQASLDLAYSGFKVYLIDTSSAIGGIMAMLDKTFPTNDCSMCIMAPKLVECARHPNIEIIINATIEGLKGKVGNYLVEVSKKARYVDLNKCTGCGECKKHCPVEILDEFNQRLNSRRAIYIHYPQAVPAKYLIDRKNCLGCGVCERTCLAGAIRYDDRKQKLTLNVGAIILSPGAALFDPIEYTKFGYGTYKNVVTSIEFERILSASGPFSGNLLRPGDGKAPKKIAFIQCVGSRDPHHNRGYCSSVCCTYSIKEAIIAKEHSKGELETTIFYMDIRTIGKGFEAYYNRARNEHSVRFVRAGVSKIEELPMKDLLVHYENEEGEVSEEKFDMVVLSTGFSPADGIEKLAKRLHISLNSYGFCRTSELIPAQTTGDGIFVCGTFAGPKDIPETVTQASAAAAEAMVLLASTRNSLTTKKEYPAEMELEGQEPRIGVFICQCGINIGGYVNVPAVLDYIKGLPDVVYAENNLYTCSQDTQKRIVEKIKENRLNRVVVASCTPRTHEPLFRETVREAGLNPYLFEMANIRDQCSWVHMNEPQEATQKAKDLVMMAISKARLLKPLRRVEIDVIQKALIIGGGIAGMTAAITLAEQGFEVYLVEKEEELGGNLRHIYTTLAARDVQKFLRMMTEDVKNNGLIKVFTRAKICSIKGFIGNYETEILLADGRTEKFFHGVVIIATGAYEYKPDEYLYGKNPKVITQREVEEIFLSRDANVLEERSIAASVQKLDHPTIVMIQCVGSRNENKEYCSRICCSMAIKNALQFLENNPKARLYILYKDIRTYGFREDYYRQARELGINFIRYDDNNKPKLDNNNGKLRVILTEPILKEEIAIEPDLVVLSNGIEPNPDNKELAKMLKVPLNSDGFFLEAHVKLRPVDFATEGVFVCGLAHSPMAIDEAISQAKAAAARATNILANKKYYAEATVSYVNEDLCAGCGMCTSVCHYEAIEITIKDGKRVSSVKEALCKGCGTCAASCPSGAMNQYGFTKQQIMAMVEAMK